MNPVASCPQPQQLESLVQGRLPFGQVEQLAQHLELCQRCVQTVASFKADDTLVEVIRRQAAAQGKAPDAVLKSLMERLRDMKASAGAVDPENYDFLAPAQAPGELGRLGQYRVLKVLGAGGMGVVFQAEDTQLKRIVALKAMRPALAASPTAKQRFVREAQASAAMKHDHIITIYQVGEERSVPFLAMEFLEGTSLEDYLKKGKPMTLGQILRIGREIAEGLAAAHQRNLVHRDIKPANIWLEAPKGRIKILDFGLARSTDEQTNITLAGAIVGTPAYMAPEQASSKPTDHRTDLYSLGCVLYRLCTGDVPFRGDNAMATLLAMATEEVRPVRTLNPAISEPLANLVMKLLAKNPEERYQSAQEVMSAIAAIERGKQTTGRAGDVSPPVTAKDTQRLFGDMHPPSQIIAARGPKPRRSNARFAVLIGVATLVLLAGAVAAWQIVIRIKRGDSQVEITAPAGAAVEVQKDGKVIATINPAPAQPKKEPAPRTEKYDDKTESQNARYLVDMKETSFAVEWGGEIGKGVHSSKSPNANKPIMVGGKAHQRALFMHGTSNGASFVTYDLGGKYTTFQTAVAIEDSCKCQSPVTFVVLGDGKTLWKSTDGKACTVNVSGVKQLELRLLCAGPHNGSCGVWIDPVLTGESGKPRVVMSQQIGGRSGNGPFESIADQGNVLVGFKYKTRFDGDRTEIAYLQPIYQGVAAKQVMPGFGHEPDSKAQPDVEAKDGYAVGALVIWHSEFNGFDLVRGIKIQFMRRKGAELDPKDSYWSQWLGLPGEGKGSQVGGDGKSVIGIHGRAGGAINCLGIVQKP